MKTSSRRPRRPTYPNRLWNYRKRMGFTQKQVAAIIGHVTRTQIGNWEGGHRVPTLLSALKLEIVYRVPIAFLYPDLYRMLKDKLHSREARLRPTWSAGKTIR